MTVPHGQRSTCRPGKELKSQVGFPALTPAFTRVDRTVARITHRLSQTRHPQVGQPAQRGNQQAILSAQARRVGPRTGTP